MPRVSAPLSAHLLLGAGCTWESVLPEGLCETACVCSAYCMLSKYVCKGRGGEGGLTLIILLSKNGP